MLFSRRTQDHISGIDLFHRTSPALHEAATGRHDERLTERMCMPCRAGPRLERHTRTLHAPRGTCLEQGLDAHLAGEPIRRSLARRSRTACLDFHVFHAPLSTRVCSSASTGASPAASTTEQQRTPPQPPLSNTLCPLFLLKNPRT